MIKARWQYQIPHIPGLYIICIPNLYGLVVIRTNVPIIPATPTVHCGQSTVYGKSGFVKHLIIPNDEHLVIKSEVNGSPSNACLSSHLKEC